MRDSVLGTEADALMSRLAGGDDARQGDGDAGMQQSGGDDDLEQGDDNTAGRLGNTAAAGRLGNRGDGRDAVTSTRRDGDDADDSP